ncbi:hypothetical protein HMPREF1121_01036 [Porphyromonas sp. KLE 1280]|nr:hypothetical protein HMPREF1121_01036 [Porphyromonas sp. KLE 1280]
MDQIPMIRIQVVVVVHLLRVVVPSLVVAEAEGMEALLILLRHPRLNH